MRKTLPLLYCLLFLFYFSCKKVNHSAIEDPVNPFFQLSHNSNRELQLVINNLKEKFSNDAVNNFLSWHGQPLWNKALSFKKDEENFTLYIPTKKHDKEKLETFFIAQYKKGKFYYEMHRRNALNRGIKEHTKFSYTQRDIAKILAYLDYAVLNKKDTLFLNNALDGAYAYKARHIAKEARPSALLQMLCYESTVEVPCGNVMNKVPDANMASAVCYESQQTCVYFDVPAGGSEFPGGGYEGGYGSGEGGGTGGTNSTEGGNCANCPASPQCPEDTWYNYLPCESVPSSVQTIINNVTNPCLNEVYNKISAPNLDIKSKLIKLLNDLTTDKNVNITINESANLDTVYAQTYGTGGDNYVIEINKNVTYKASQEFIALIYLHEAIHAYLKYHITEYDLVNNNAHIVMFQNYFTDLVNTLKGIFPTLSDRNAKCLVFEDILRANI